MDLNQEAASKQKKRPRSTTYIKAGTIRSLAEKQRSLFLSKTKFPPANSAPSSTENLRNAQLLPHPDLRAHTTEERLPNSTPSAQTVEEQQLDSTTSTMNEQCEEQGPSANKRQRGRTQMQSVHARTDRKVIVLNKLNQPVGPTKSVVTEFSSFLGTLARNPTLCPLDVCDWRKMDTKFALWEYTKGKYDIPEAAKKWTLEAIQHAWRSYKSRLKRDHFDPYDNDTMRMENRPTDVAESVFKELLIYWNSDKAQKLSKTNVDNRKKLKNPHTVGKTSFAVIRGDLEKEMGSDNVTLKDIFKKTRARKAGRSYKESDEDTVCKMAEIEKLEAQQSQDGGDPANVLTSVMGPEHPGRLRLYGRAVTKTSLGGRVGNFEPSSSASNDQEQSMEEMMKKVEEKILEQKEAMRQEIVADIISQLRCSGYEIDVSTLAAPQGAIQPVRRPSVGSNNQGEANEKEVEENSDELDLT